MAARTFAPLSVHTRGRNRLVASANPATVPLGSAVGVALIAATTPDLPMDLAWCTDWRGLRRAGQARPRRRRWDHDREEAPEQPGFSPFPLVTPTRTNVDTLVRHKGSASTKHLPEIICVDTSRAVVSTLGIRTPPHVGRQ